jgi:DNA polymerase III sliding clamp (beta) subunit (PCNA family)
VHTPSSVKGEHIEIAINHKYIFESLQSISQDSVTFSFQDVSKPVVVRGVSDSSFTYLVMPMTR